MIRPEPNSEFHTDVGLEPNLDVPVLLGPDGKEYREDKLYIWPWENWVQQGISHAAYRPPEFYGTAPKHMSAWFEINGGHKHTFDVRLWIGAPRSGKSVTTVARFIYLAYTYPGVQLVVGSLNYQYMLDTIGRDYKNVLTLPGQADWSHPFVKHGIDKYNKHIEFANGSVIYFKNMEDGINKVLGMGVEGFHLEQPELLSDYSYVFDIVLTRMSGTHMPFRVFYNTANPLANLESLETIFGLDRFEPGYNGPPQHIDKMCRCNFCNICGVKGMEVEWVDGVCPECSARKKSKCPGHQPFVWVIHCDQSDNPNLPESYHADMKALMSEERHEAMAQGRVHKVGKGKCYPNYSARNLIGNKTEFDLDRDLYWTHDFNNFPMSSCMFQLKNPQSEEKYPDINVKREIVGWGVGAATIANRFVQEYGHLAAVLKGLIRLNGDPHNGQPDMIDDRFHVIQRILKKAGFKVIIDVIKTRVLIADRILTTNFFLHDSDRPRLFIDRQSCPYLCAGLDKLLWGPTGKKEDERFDRRARESKQYHLTWPMSHMPASLGYALFRHWPVVEKGNSTAFMLDINQSLVTEVDEGMVTQTYLDPEELREFLGQNTEFADLAYDPEELEDWETKHPRPKSRQKTIAEELRHHDLWKLGA